MNQVLFREEQKFTQWWIYLLLFAILGFSLYSVFQQIFLGIPVGNNPVSDSGEYVTVGVVVLLILFILSLKLITEIREDGIRFQFHPFHSRPRFLSWEEISEVELVEYRPIREYGGWGLRFGRGGRAFNVKGNIGLKVHLTTGRHILFGTQDPDSVSQTLASLDIQFTNRLDKDLV